MAADAGSASRTQDLTDEHGQLLRKVAVRAGEGWPGSLDPAG